MLSNCVRRFSRVAAPLVARQYSSVVVRPTCSHLHNVHNNFSQSRCFASDFTGQHHAYEVKRVVSKAGGARKPERHTAKEIETLLLDVIQKWDRFPEGKTELRLLPTAASFSGALQTRAFADKPPLTQKTLEERILLVLKLFDKIDPTKVSLDTHLLNDLGLDSLDHVEIIMAIEDEFLLEIPDSDAESLLTPRQIYQYICDVEDVIE